MNTPVYCPQCGAPLPQGLLQGLCPRCVGRQAAGILAAHAGIAQSAHSTPPPVSLRYFGDYELVEEIARGGMGVVWKARQVSLDRMVAVKMLLSGQFAQKEFVERFRAEARAVANLQHPNIVAIHEVGENEGQQYFSMDYVEGQDLAELAREQPLPARRAARYLKTIAEAVHYAHQRGVIHRDLKPSNVLLDANDQPRVTDFGLAKFIIPPVGGQGVETPKAGPTNDLTLTGQVLGTPGYMPPEQVGGRRGAVGPVADVYSLGAVLYFQLTGRAPFAADSLEETLRQVLQVEPVPPRLLNPAVPRDLDTLCLKCLEKEPRSRYASAQDLAEELGRFLEDKPIRARPVSVPEKIWRWCRRNPAVAALSATALLILVTGLAGVLWQWRKAEAARQLAAENATAETRAASAAKQESKRAKDALELIQVKRAEELFTTDDASTALAYLARVVRQNPSNRVAAERLASALTQRSFGLLAIPPLRHPARVTSAQFSLDGQRLVTASADGTVRVWDALTGQPFGRPLAHQTNVTSAQFSPDGKRIITTSDDTTARLWDAETSQPLTEPLRHPGAVWSAQFSPNGLRLVTIVTRKWSRSGDAAYLWDAFTGRPVGDPIRLEWPIQKVEHHPDGREVVTMSSDAVRLLCVQFSQDGLRLFTVFEDATVRVWDADTGRPLGEPVKLQEPGRFGPGPDFAQFSPDGRRVITAKIPEMDDVRVWDARTGRPLSEVFRDIGRGSSILFSPDGQRFVYVYQYGNLSGPMKVFDALTGQPLIEPIKDPGYVTSVHFSPDGLRLVTVSSGGTRVWDTQTGLPLIEPINHPTVSSVKFSPDGQHIATVSADNAVRVWSVLPGHSLSQQLKHQGVTYSYLVSLETQRIVSTEWDDSIVLWNSDTGKPLGASPATTDEFPRTSPLGELLAEKRDANRPPRFSPDGQRMATSYEEGVVRVWDMRTGRLLGQPLGHQTNVVSTRFSPDGQRLVTTARDNTARVWDVQTGLLIGDPLKHQAFVSSVLFSPDGRRIVTGSSGGIVQVWDVQTGKPVHGSLKVQTNAISAQFSPDGRRIVTVEQDGTARVWDLQEGQSLSQLLEGSASVLLAQFSPDGQRIATVSKDNTARVWDVRTGRPLIWPLPHRARVKSVQFRLDSQAVVTASDDKTARIWDAQTGQPLCEPLNHERLWRAEFSLDGQRVITRSTDDAMQVWDVPAFTLPLPDDRLARLAEALVGRRLNESGIVEMVSEAEFLSIRQELTESKANDRFTHWAKWFLADRSTRVISPFSSIAVPDYVRRRINEGEIEAGPESERLAPKVLDEIARLTPTNSTLARLAQDLLTRGDPRAAEFLALNVLSVAKAVAASNAVLARLERQAVAQMNRLLGSTRLMPEVYREAVLLAPTNALALARLARQVLAQDPKANPRRRGEADFLSRRALALAPDEPEVMQIRSNIVKELGR